MTDRPDYPQVSSEEMIKQARSDLDRRPTISDMEIDTEGIRQQVEQDMPSPKELIEQPPARRPSPRTARRVSRVDRTTPTGFGEPRPRPRATISVAVAIALLVLGAAVVLALASGSG